MLILVPVLFELPRERIWCFTEAEKSCPRPGPPAQLSCGVGTSPIAESARDSTPNASTESHVCCARTIQ